MQQVQKAIASIKVASYAIVNQQLTVLDFIRNITSVQLGGLTAFSATTRAQAKGT